MRSGLFGVAALLLASNCFAQQFVSGQLGVTGSSQLDINSNGQIDVGESQNANAAFVVASTSGVSGSGGTSTGGVFATMNFSSAIAPIASEAGQRQFLLTFSAEGTAICPTTSSSAFASLTCTSNLDNLPILLDFGGTENYTYTIAETQRLNVSSFNFVDANSRNAVSGGSFPPGRYAFDYASNMFVSGSTPGTQSRMVWSMTITQLPSPTQLPMLAVAALGLVRKRFSKAG